MNGSRILLLPLLILAWLAAVAGPVSGATDPITMRWTVDGVERQALVFVPSPGGADARMPLVFAFHGHGGSMAAAAREMAIQVLWPEALVVYPQGLRTPAKRVDPLGFRAGWQFAVGEKGDRDLKLFDAMLASLRAQYPVDGRRIYATGFSNGGFFSYFLWATRGSAFAAFASCAGRIWNTLQLSTPKPILQISGEKDHIVPYAAQAKTIAAVRALDETSDAGESCGAGCTLYPSPRQAPVETIIHADGHVYPPWASAKIVEFLKSQTLPR